MVGGLWRWAQGGGILREKIFEEVKMYVMKDIIHEKEVLCKKREGAGKVMGKKIINEMSKIKLKWAGFG